MSHFVRDNKKLRFTYQNATSELEENKEKTLMLTENYKILEEKVSKIIVFSIIKFISMLNCCKVWKLKNWKKTGEFRFLKSTKWGYLSIFVNFYLIFYRKTEKILRKFIDKFKHKSKKTNSQLEESHNNSIIEEETTNRISLFGQNEKNNKEKDKIFIKINGEEGQNDYEGNRFKPREEHQRFYLI